MHNWLSETYFFTFHVESELIAAPFNFNRLLPKRFPNLKEQNFKGEGSNQSRFQINLKTAHTLDSSCLKMLQRSYSVPPVLRFHFRRILFSQQ